MSMSLNVNRRRSRPGRRLGVFPAVQTRGLPARARDPVELRAMGSSMVSGQSDPVPVDSTIKVQHRVQLLVTTPSTPGTVTPVSGTLISAQLPGGATGSAGWNQYRLLKIDAWGSDTANITINMSGATSSGSGDAAVFTDWGTPGSRRATLHVRPNLSLRTQWNIAGATAFALFGLSSLTASVPVIVNLTLELQSLPVASPQ
jgi:hypothetical protein